MFWDVFGQLGHPLKTTLSEMGPLLLSRLMELNETQSSVLQILFKIADDSGLLLIDMKDITGLINLVQENLDMGAFLRRDKKEIKRDIDYVVEEGKVIIIESKSVFEYLRQLESFGEETTEYESIWGYSMGETEPRMPIYDYPNYDFTITEKMTHLDLGG